MVIEKLIQMILSLQWTLPEHVNQQELDEMYSVATDLMSGVNAILAGFNDMTGADNLIPSLISLLPEDKDLLLAVDRKLDALDQIPLMINGDKIHACDDEKENGGTRYFIASTPASLGTFFMAVQAKSQGILTPKNERQKCLLAIANLFFQCEEYKQHLQNEINAEMKLAGLYSPHQANPAYYKQKKSLEQGYANDNQDFKDLLAKYQVIQGLQSILCSPQIEGAQRVKTFKKHLKKNMQLLTKRRDPFFKTFLKAVAVILATVATTPFLGMGGVLAYQSLFSTRGGKFAANAEKLAIVPIDDEGIELCALKKKGRKFSHVSST